MFMDKNNQPYVIAGPCSVESRAQLEAVTEAMRKVPQVKMIRAGVWKPRTQPGGFEGLGEQALRWMQQLSNRYSVQYCCEVVRPEHVSLCHRYGIRTVWIGARTTANPFMVDEICQALQGSDMTVLVKNPVCPDVRLWIGAIERLHKIGVREMAAVHRGFSMYDNQGYRNAPLWDVAMELRHQMPQLPILCDPSHIGGKASLVAQLAHRAMLLNYDGLMVEIHPHPADALTDALQQLTPAELRALLDTLPNPSASSASTAPELDNMRLEIDDIDQNLLRLLAKRMEVSRNIASLKHRLNMSVYQPDRWGRMMNDRLALAEQMQLKSDFVKELMEKIHAESVRIQMENSGQG